MICVILLFLKLTTGGSRSWWWDESMTSLMLALLEPAGRAPTYQAWLNHDAQLHEPFGHGLGANYHLYIQLCLCKCRLSFPCYFRCTKYQTMYVSRWHLCSYHIPARFKPTCPLSSDICMLPFFHLRLLPGGNHCVQWICLVLLC